MLGYSTIAEWVANQYPISDVIEEDQKKGIKAYMDASRHFRARRKITSMICYAP